MKQDQKEKENPKTFKWYLDKILMVAVAVFFITGLVIWIVATENDNMTMMFVGAAMIPGTGLFMAPNIVLTAIKDSKEWKSRTFKDRRGRSFSRQLHNEDFFYEITYPSPYHSKILWGVIREAILNFGVLIIPIVYFIIRNVILFIFGMSRFEGKAVLFLLIIVAILIPAFSYNLTCSICRIRTVLRREYGVYHAVVSKANGLDMYITGQNGKVYKFEYCRCLGIRAKKIHNTRVILVFVPDEVYLLPYYKQS